ncbi:MAG: peptidoglycan DD-metalloendopeptidase family protein [Bacteroidetes bacterium]|nr:peptidoglycan DD-metalloendopeptidase family protein [Bacteroidota bacterium]
MKKQLLFILWLCTSALPLLAQSVKFVKPIEGVAGKDFYLVNYMDHDSTKGLKDINCIDKTYDGHTGTDMVLRSFLSMDSGYAVYAAAKGKVMVTRDNMYDRNKKTNTNGFGNYISINHKDTLYTYYAHLKKGSILVNPGDSVQAGQKIGLVACSGNCFHPHLHFEVWTQTQNIDPFVGSCYKKQNLWATPFKYDTSLKIIEAGFVPYVPNIDTLVERFDVRDTFSQKDTIVTFWTLLQGLRQGDSTTVYWYTPGNTYWYSYTYVMPNNAWFFYWYSYINRPPMTMPGKWTAYFYVGKNLVLTKNFYLTKNTMVEDLIPATYSISNTHEGVKIQSSEIINPSSFSTTLFGIEGKAIPINFSMVGDREALIQLPKNISAGVYMLRLNDAKGSTTKKFIIW